MYVAALGYKVLAYKRMLFDYYFYKFSVLCASRSRQASCDQSLGNHNVLPWVHLASLYFRGRGDVFDVICDVVDLPIYIALLSQGSSP